MSDKAKREAPAVEVVQANTGDALPSAIKRWYVPAREIGRRYSDAKAKINGWGGMTDTRRAVLWTAIDNAVRQAVIAGELRLNEGIDGPLMAPSESAHFQGWLSLERFCSWAPAIVDDCPKSATELAEVMGLRVPHFVIKARPEVVPPELLTLPDDARVTFEHIVGRASVRGTTNASDCREMVREIVERQADGFFTPDEAAQVLADSRNKIDPNEAVMRFQIAHRKGELQIRQAGSRLPLSPNETTHHYHHLLKAAELDAWLRREAGYGFPDTESSAGLAMDRVPETAQEPAPDRGRHVKRAALITNNMHRWPTVERDVKDAATNGLRQAAKDASKVGWWWEGSAIEWARARAKVRAASAGLPSMGGSIHRLKG